MPEVIGKGKLEPSEIKGICISGLHPCVIALDNNGKALRLAMIWQDQRAPKGWLPLQQNNPLFNTGKVLWVKENEPEIYRNTYKFLFNSESVINCKLTGKFMATASATGGGGSRKILVEQFEKYGLDVDKIPDFFESTDLIGGVTKKAAEETGFIEGTPLVAGHGDGRGATIGVGAVRDEFGFGMLGHTMSSRITSKGERRGGGASAGGAILRWYRDLFSKEEIEVA